MKYKLHIYGDERVQDQKRHFHELSDAIESVEGQVTSDHGGWMFTDDGLSLVDQNHGGPAVIHKVTSVEDGDVPSSITVYESPVFSPDG